MGVRNIWADATCFEELLPCGRGAAAAQFLLTRFSAGAGEAAAHGRTKHLGRCNCFEELLPCGRGAAAAQFLLTRFSAGAGEAAAHGRAKHLGRCDLL